MIKKLIVPGSALRLLGRAAGILLACYGLSNPKAAIAQSLQIVNMAIPAKSFQMVIYPIAQQKGYMNEEGIDQRVIFIAPTTSIQALLGGDAHFTGAGSSAPVSIARSNIPLKVVVATNDRVLQWLVTRPEITGPKELKGQKDRDHRSGRGGDLYAPTGSYQIWSRRQQRCYLPGRRPGQSTYSIARRRV